MTDAKTICPGCRQVLEPRTEVCERCGQEFCPSCFAPIAPEAAGCAACGAEFAVFCPQCDHEIAADSERCPHCGYVFDNSTTEVISSRAALAQATLTEAGLRGELQEELTDGECPACGEPVFTVDGYCEACEATFCPECIRIIDEDDDVCPHCGVILYFDCPLCGFELTAGTDLCPACGALFYQHCPSCAAEVDPLAGRCSACGVDLPVEQRASARVIQTLVVGQGLVRVFACTSCGSKFDSLNPECPQCGQSVCPNCQLILYEEEEFCPRCRPDITARLMAERTVPGSQTEVSPASCPTCGAEIPAGESSCVACGQELCPSCQAAIGEDDLSCPSCGAEFELICPNCEAVIDPEAERCSTCGADL